MAEYQTFAFTDDTADLFLDKFGNLAMADDINALSYIVLNVVRTVRGELIYDGEIGVPYFTTIFASPPNLSLWSYYVKEAALSVPGVSAVDSFVYENNGGEISYEMVVKTNIGEVTVNG